jgi:hypothetical protein
MRLRTDAFWQVESVHALPIDWLRIQVARVRAEIAKVHARLREFPSQRGDPGAH